MNNFMQNYSISNEKKTQRLKSYIYDVLKEKEITLTKLNPETNFALIKYYKYREYNKVLKNPKEMIPLNRTLTINKEQYNVCMLFLTGGLWNIYIGGRAGTGKTVTLKYLIENCEKYYLKSEYYKEEREYFLENKEEELKELNKRLETEKNKMNKKRLLNEIEKKKKETFVNKKIVVTGSMGVSACNINGMTLHSLFGLFKNTSIAPDEMIKTIPLNKRKVIMNMEILIIEEISMISNTLFEYINRLMQLIRGNEFPFGGVRVITVGDFNQLGPIEKTDEEEKRGGEKEEELEKKRVDYYYNPTIEEMINERKEEYEQFKGIYCFESDCWKKGIGNNVAYLVDIMRQNKQEIEFLNFLEKVRTASLTIEDKKWFVEKTILRDSNKNIKSTLEASDITSTTTVIHVTNIQVSSINILKIINIGTEARVYSSIDTGKLKVKTESTYPNKLMLKLGAKVMLLYNMDIDKSLYNGSIGYVVEFNNENNFPFIYFPLDQSERIVFPDPTEKDQYKEIHQFISQLKVEKANRIFQISPFLWKSEIQYITEFERFQLPLNLAYSLTVHKTQGLTLTDIIIDTLHMTQPGSLYTALTRTKSIDNIFLYNQRISNFLKYERNLEIQEKIIDNWISPIKVDTVLQFTENCKINSINNIEQILYNDKL